MSTETLRETDEAAIQQLLIGRRIVSAETGTFDVPGRDGWGASSASGRLTLDNGARVLVVPNEGGCSCSAGDYDLAHLATVDNVITSVRVADEEPAADEDGWRGEDAHAYRVYVVADAVEVNVLSVEGDDGNGYYGTGYELIVIPAGASA